MRKRKFIQVKHSIFERLTKREKEVQLMRAAGKTKQQCADKLNCTPDNIGDHNKEIHRKLKANCAVMSLGMAVAIGEVTRDELIFFYTTMGLL